MAMTVEQLIERLQRVSDKTKDAVIFDTESGDQYEVSRVTEPEDTDEVLIVTEEIPRL